MTLSISRKRTSFTGSQQQHINNHDESSSSNVGRSIVRRSNSSGPSASRRRSNKSCTLDNISRSQEFTTRMSRSNSIDDSCCSTSTHLEQPRCRSTNNTDEPSPTTVVVAPSSTLRKSKALEELTIHKLNQKNLKLHGRDKELQTLNACLEKLIVAPESRSSDDAKQQQQQQQLGKKQLVFLSGVSGSGKSALAATLASPIQRVQGVHVRGKFDLYLRNTPFAGILSVADKLCQEIMERKQKNPDVFLQIRESLLAAIGDEMLVELQAVFPKLVIALAVDANDNNDGNPKKSDRSLCSSKDGLSVSEQSTRPKTTNHPPNNNKVSMQFKNAFNFSFRAFIRVFCHHIHPVVLVLDDFQWADASSFEFIESILKDDTIHGLMVILAYRSNEVTETHALTKMRNDLLLLASSSMEQQQQQQQQQEQAVTNTSQNNNNNRMDVTEIYVGNLSVTAANEVLQALLKMEDEDPQKTLPLAELCHKKTLGNPFHFIQFLSMLVEERQLLNYNFGLMKWTWNIDTILTKTQASENVVGLMKLKMLKQSRNIQQTLTLAAFLGANFQQRSLEFIWPHFKTTEGQHVSMNELYRELQVCVHEGFLEETSSSTTNTTHSFPARLIRQEEEDDKGDTTTSHNNNNTKYTWVHDSIQEAAFSLIEESNNKEDFLREKMSERIGYILLHNLSSEEDFEASLFTITNLLNNGMTAQNKNHPSSHHHHQQQQQDLMDRYFELANMNLKAARKASNFSAFDSALVYIDKGIRHLPQDDTEKWSPHNRYNRNSTGSGLSFYALTLELYSLGAELAACTGEFERMEFYCSKVLKQESLLPTTMDRLRIYNAQISSRISTSQFEEGAAIAMYALDICGCRVPKVGTASITASLLMSTVKLKATWRNRTSEELESLPFMEDEMKIEQMKLLDKLCTCCYNVEKLKDLLPVATFRMHNYTLKYGVSIYSPSAFAITAFVLSGVLEDIRGGTLYANYALKLLEKLPDSKVVESRTFFVLHYFVFHWTHPLVSSLKPLLHSYESGLQMGDTESGTYSIAIYIIHSYHSGKSLETIERDCRVYEAQMRQLGRDALGDQVLALRPLLLNLSGKSGGGGDTTVNFIGEAVDETKYQELVSKKSTSAIFYSYHFLAYSYFGDYESCVKMALSKDNTIKEDMPGTMDLVVHTFHKGLAFCSKATSKSGSRKYKNLAKQSSAKIKSWLKKGNPNVQHFDSILDAEISVLNGETMVAKKLYEQGINFSVRAGFLQDAALATERFSMFLSRDMKDYEEASYRWKEAIRYYRIWGAHKKADLMEQSSIEK